MANFSICCAVQLKVSLTKGVITYPFPVSSVMNQIKPTVVAATMAASGGRHICMSQVHIRFILLTTSMWSLQSGR